MTLEVISKKKTVEINMCTKTMKYSTKHKKKKNNSDPGPRKPKNKEKRINQVHSLYCVERKQKMDVQQSHKIEAQKESN